MSTNKATVFPELRDTFGVLTTREQKIIFDIVKQWADSLTTELTLENQYELQEWTIQQMYLILKQVI
jgi:hypothetical protein